MFFVKAAADIRRSILECPCLCHPQGTLAKASLYVFGQSQHDTKDCPGTMRKTEVIAQPIGRLVRNKAED